MNIEYKPNLISVIIPTYNRYNLLNRAIASVLNQTYKNYEILVINDCSTDENYYNGSLEKNEKTTVIHLDINQRKKYNVLAAQGIVRQIGIEKSVGDWISFLDDDDIFLPNKLEIQMNALKSKNMLMCTTNMYKIKTDGINDSFIIDGLYFNCKYPETFTYNIIVRDNLINTSSVVIHKSVLNKAGPFNLGKNEDKELWLRVLKWIDCLYLELPLVYYTINNVKEYN